MSDIKLFRLGTEVEELPGSSVAVEKALQSLLEQHLETFLGVRFLASEYSTGKTHGGRIDTLGIDENNSPVIIEYKRSTNQNVINQGLYYLDWLLDHQADFELLTRKRLGEDVADKVDWSAPRLVCIAGGFTKYDEHAVRLINRNLELLRYRSYDGFLVLELVNATSGSAVAVGTREGEKGKQTDETVRERYEEGTQALRDLFDALDAHLTALGDDVTRETLKHYFAYRRIKNLASVVLRPQSQELLVYLKVNPDDVTLEDGFTRDVRTIGHLGTGELEVRIGSTADIERARPLIEQSYDAS